MANLSEVYKYNTNSGVVLPQYDKARDYAVQKFKEALGPDIDTTAETAVGRLIEAWATAIMISMKVAAQNAGNFNPRIAIGGYLDNIGAMFGVDRFDGESDNAYRLRILASQSTGIGFPQSIRRAVSQVANVTSVTVLENGYDVPVNEGGITLAPHSIFVCVGGGDDTEVARAIFNSKSAGCAYTSEVPNLTPFYVEITDTSSHGVYFFRPVEVTVDVSYTINGRLYSGTDIIADAKALVEKAFAEYAVPGGGITASDIMAYVASAGTGISIYSLKMQLDGAAYDATAFYPYQIPVIGTHNAEVVY